MTKKDLHAVAKAWREGAKDSLRIAEKLKKGREYVSALFFLHLFLEKTLKSLIVEKKRSHAPFTHNLPALYTLLGLPLQDRLMEDLTKITGFNIEGRYSDDLKKLKKITTLELYKTWEKRVKEIAKQLEVQLKD